MKTALTFLRADHGQEIRQAVGVLAVLVALTYTLGYLTGQFVHNLNDSLAGVSREIPTITAPAVLRHAEPPHLAYWRNNAAKGKPVGSAAEHQWRTAQPAPYRAPAVTMAQAPAPVPPTITAPPMESLTVAELRVMARQAGHRKLARSGRRQQLLEVLA